MSQKYSQWRLLLQNNQHEVVEKIELIKKRYFFADLQFLDL